MEVFFRASLTDFSKAVNRIARDLFTAYGFHIHGLKIKRK